MSSLPTTADDAPISCGIGTGGYSRRFAMGLGCAAKLNERLSVNVRGSHVFGRSSDYGG
ncbi:YadA-like family protein [Synechococcus sp. CC9605]|uniref:YadA-like family protein n=1 Tax=Synechococcus sp. (strain CC9605) TaxID=110662 RepID=UPI0018DB23D9